MNNEPSFKYQHFFRPIDTNIDTNIPPAPQLACFRSEF